MSGHVRCVWSSNPVGTPAPVEIVFPMSATLIHVSPSMSHLQKDKMFTCSKLDNLSTFSNNHEGFQLLNGSWRVDGLTKRFSPPAHRDDKRRDKREPARDDILPQSAQVTLRPHETPLADPHFRSQSAWS